jgi:hypothetical protein
MKRMFTVLAVALVLAAMIVATAMPAFAKIRPVDTSCTTPGGSQPSGQQPSCKGSSDTLTQDSENQNPAGKAPKGQN